VRRGTQRRAAAARVVLRGAQEEQGALLKEQGQPAAGTSSGLNKHKWRRPCSSRASPAAAVSASAGGGAAAAAAGGVGLGGQAPRTPWLACAGEVGQTLGCAWVGLVAGSPAVCVCLRSAVFGSPSPTTEGGDKRREVQQDGAPCCPHNWLQSSSTAPATPWQGVVPSNRV